MSDEQYAADQKAGADVDAAGHSKDGYRPEPHVSLSRDEDATGRIWEDAFRAMGGEPKALRHEGMTLTSVVKMLRMRHCLTFLRVDQVTLLYEHYVEKLTYEEMAASREQAKQSVFERTETSRRDLVRAVAEHWNDDLDLDLLPVQDEDDE